jgi:hypothetical protein
MVIALLRGRCFVCSRLYVLHTARQQAACDSAPLPIRLTDKGLSRLCDEQAVVPLRK